MPLAPTLETERLLLRDHRPGDFENYAALWGRPDVTRFIGGVPFTREQAWTRFLRQPGMWALVGYGFWAIEDKSTGRFIGETGFLHLKRELQPSLDDSLETGWILSPETHGKGLAREAVEAALAWAEATRPTVRVTCMIDPGNDASIRLAGKMGYREFARTTYHGAPVALFERRKP